MTEAVCLTCAAVFIPKRKTVGKFFSRHCSNVGPRTPRHPDRRGGRSSWVDHHTRQAVILAAVQAGPQSGAALANRLDCRRHTAKAECMALRDAGAIKVVKVGKVKQWALPTWKPAPKPAPPVRGPRPAIERQGLRQPAPPPPTVDIAPSWWVGCSREGLQVGAQQRQEAMRASKENFRIPLRILQ